MGKSGGKLHCEHCAGQVTQAIIMNQLSVPRHLYLVWSEQAAGNSEKTTPEVPRLVRRNKMSE